MTDTPSTLDRRTLLRLAGTGALAAAAPAVAAGGTAEAAAEKAPARMAPRPAMYLEEATIDDLQAMIAGRRATSAMLVERYLERIDALDGIGGSGPALRSVIEVNPDAMDIARRLDEERARKGARGPLHGIPVLIKDNIDTADRMATSAGSLALAANRAARDAHLVERLRGAGAVILGKTNLSEWANFRSTRSTSGWSGRGGQTKMPYVIDRNPCGSSSGSGTAVAASLCAAAVGTETDGSIVCPSTRNGLVGVKPTLGLVSRSGIIPIAASQDTAGPMARTVRDAAILLGVLAGADPRDGASAASAGRIAADYTVFLDEKALAGKRFGVLRQYTGYHPEVDRLFGEATAALKAAGAELVDPVEIPKDSEYGDAEFNVLLYEFKVGLNAYLATCPPAVRTRSLEDLIAYNDANRADEMPFFGQEIFLKTQEKGPLSSLEYVEARARCLRLAREEGIDAALAKHRLDALIAPTGGPAWVTDWVNGDHFGGSCSTPAAVAGTPHVTVPMGQIFGLPVGLSFMGAAWSEGVLLGFAYAFEKRLRGRLPPPYLPTLMA
jgi:amidase